MLKQITSLAAVTVILGVLSSCTGASSEGTSTAGSSSQAPEAIALKVWGPSQDQTYLAGKTVEFDTLHPEWDITWTIEDVGEPNAKAALLIDVEAGADVFTFPDDQLKALVDAGALSKVEQFKTTVTDRNIAWSVDAASIGTDLYAYPYTADNGSFMYYDKSQITEAEMATLDGILAKAETLGKNILIDPQGGWVSGGWFSANGNISYANGVQTCDFNNAAGLASAQGMWNAYSTGHIIRSEPAIVSQFLDGNIFAGISGTWNAAAMEEVLGANYGAIKLPTFTNGLDVQQQLGTMVGAKLLGVNGFTDEPMAAHAFSEWLTNSDNQIARCEAVGNGPSNLVALESEAVTSNIALSALASQAPFGILQAKSVGSQYWTPAGAFADYLITNSTLADPTERAAAYDLLQDQLDAMVAQIIATS